MVNATPLLELVNVIQDFLDMIVLKKIVLLIVITKDYVIIYLEIVNVIKDSKV